MSDVADFAQATKGNSDWLSIVGHVGELLVDVARSVNLMVVCWGRSSLRRGLPTTKITKHTKIHSATFMSFVVFVVLLLAESSLDLGGSFAAAPYSICLAGTVIESLSLVIFRPPFFYLFAWSELPGRWWQENWRVDRDSGTEQEPCGACERCQYFSLTTEYWGVTV
ncbi:hypothetical protein [Roseimaritima ulvae]|uniref:Uncharacterized protein n=1 Tax=Roseimaritima ulvae TaxID=980254 RepID=A0A5B9QRB7_9BACT|nr:hypothetical protein [Roseimaritima ulvae]QEG40210.1 hypothetical protein UC8_22170 [Roseimaritima ulvae]